MSRNNIGDGTYTRPLYQGKIPFSPTEQEQVCYADPLGAFAKMNGKWTRVNYDWRTNKPFSADLVFLEFLRGRSAANFIGRVENTYCEDVDYGDLLDGCKVTIFMSDMLEMVKNSKIENGRLKDGLFDFVKKGSNYGIHLIHENE